MPWCANEGHLGPDHDITRFVSNLSAMEPITLPVAPPHLADAGVFVELLDVPC